MKYTREIAEEVLNDLNEYNDNILHNTIEEFLDHKFKPQLPETGWLKGAGSAIIYRTGATSGYGINHGKWEINEWSFISFPEAWQPATKEEVEYALINFARKQGYKNGNYKCLVESRLTDEVNEDVFHTCINDYLFDLWHGEEEGHHNLVFNSSTGEWAKIIEDENKELKEQIDKLEKQLNDLKARL